MMKILKLGTILFLTVLILIGSFQLASSVGVVPWFRISDIPALQGSSSIAYNSTTDQFLVVWEDWRGDVGFGSDVYAQIVNSDSSMSGGNFSITVVNDWQRSPKPAYNPVTNRYLVVWEDQNYDGKGDIYGRMVNANGTLSLTQFPIATAAEYQWNPDLAYNSATNQFLVVWQDDRSGVEEDIYGQLVNPDRTLSGNNFPISNPSVNSLKELLPAIAYNTTNNQYLVVWEDYRNPASDADIYGRVVNANGTLNGADFAISTASADQDYPAIAYASSANRFLVVWEQSNDIYGRLVNADKSLSGSDFRIASSSGVLSNPKVSYNQQSDQFMVVWSDSYGWDDIYAQLVGMDGSMPEAVIELASQGMGDLDNPAITSSTTDNTFMAAWTHQTCHNEFDGCDESDEYDIDIFGAFYQATAHFRVYLPVLLRDYQAPTPTTPPPTTPPPTTPPPTTPPPTTPPPTTPPPTTPAPTPDPWVEIMTENFEGSFPGVWTVLDDYPGYGEYFWGKRDCRGFVGTYSGWAVGGGADGSVLSCGSSYPGFVKSWMIYGPSNLTDATAAEFSYQAWINTGSAASLYQNFCRMASTDGINFYGDCFRGNSGGGIEQTLDLSNVTDLGSVIGQSQVYVALYFENLSTEGTTEGVYVDEIILQKCTTASCTSSAATPSSLEMPDLNTFPAVKSLNHPLP